MSYSLDMRTPHIRLNCVCLVTNIYFNASVMTCAWSIFIVTFMGII